MSAAASNFDRSKLIPSLPGGVTRPGQKSVPKKAALHVPRILLVHDDSDFLQKLRLELAGLAPEWKIFASSNPSKALTNLEEHPVDLVACSSQLSSFNSVEFVQLLQKHHPQIIRFVLTENVEEEFSLRSIIHCQISASLEVSVLFQAIDEALQVSQTPIDPKLQQVVDEFALLPDTAPVCRRIFTSLHDPHTIHTHTVEEILNEDAPIAAKVRFVANNPYFRSGAQSADLHNALLFLGTDILKGVVLAAKAFEQIASKKSEARLTHSLWSHSVRTAILAHSITWKHTENEQLADGAFTAGLLHDVGKLLLNQAFGRKYKRVLKISKIEKKPLWEMENSIFANSHAEVGAHLLNRWRLSPDIAEAVAYHHTPQLAPGNTFSCVTTLHIANCVEHQKPANAPLATGGVLDVAYLQSLGLPSKLSHWTPFLELKNPRR